MSLSQPVIQIFQYYSTGNARAFMLGGGLGYIVSNGFWHHIPLVILNPFVYSSYQLFVSKKDVIKWCKESNVMTLF